MTDTTTTITTTPAKPDLTHVLTILAQVMGWVITAFGGILTTYATTHPAVLWPGVAVVAMGILIQVVSHYGYVKGQTLGAIVSNQPNVEDIVNAIAAPLVSMLSEALSKAANATPGTTVQVNAGPGVSPGAVAAVVADALKPPSVAPVYPPASPK